MSACASQKVILCENHEPQAEVSLRALSLAEIGTEFLALQLRLGLLMETQQKTWPSAAWTEEREREWLMDVDPLRDRMAVLRSAALKCLAHSLADLKIKAMILADLVEDDPQDACAQLALSLCRDLIALPDA